MAKPNLLIVSTGGTITMTAGGGAGIAPRLTAEDLMAAVPRMGELANIETLTFSTIPGASLTFPSLIELTCEIDQRCKDGVDGVIIVQGTDTIEETSFLLDLLLPADTPVIVTGAMRGAHMAGADGPANLQASAIVAGATAARGRGVMVVLNDEIHAARHVRKQHTGLVSSFVSTPSGPLGLVCEGRALFLDEARSRRRVLPRPSGVADVAVVKACLGDDGRFLRKVAELGYRGLVVEAMGAGHVPEAWAEALGELAAALPTILSVRTPDGPVFRSTYGFIGSETDLLGRGLVPSGLLGPLKARLLLGVLLGLGESRESIQAHFLAHGYPGRI